MTCKDEVQRIVAAGVGEAAGGGLRVPASGKKWVSACGRKAVGSGNATAGSTWQ